MPLINPIAVPEPKSRSDATSHLSILSPHISGGPDLFLVCFAQLTNPQADSGKATLVPGSQAGEFNLIDVGPPHHESRSPLPPGNQFFTAQPSIK